MGREHGRITQVYQLNMVKWIILVIFFFFFLPRFTGYLRVCEDIEVEFRIRIRFNMSEETQPYEWSSISRIIPKATISRATISRAIPRVIKSTPSEAALLHPWAEASAHQIMHQCNLRCVWCGKKMRQMLMTKPIISTRVVEPLYLPMCYSRLSQGYIQY